MNRHLLLLLTLLLGGSPLCLTGCPTGDDDDATGDDDDATSDDDDATGDDDDATGDDDDATGDDDDATGDDDDATGDDDDATGDDDDATGEAFSVLGVWEDAFGSSHAGTELGWISWDANGLSRYDVSQYNATGPLIAQNAEANTYNPGLWSRFDFTTDAGQAYMCQTAYAAATEEAAAMTVPADSLDLASGCGGFGWSAITPSTTALVISGVYVDGYGGDNTVTSTSWTVVNGKDVARFAITQYDNAAGYAIAENDANNSFNGGLWTRFDFAEVNGAWWTCSTAYDAATEAAALATPAADSTDPSTGGCGGYPWTNLTP